MKQFSGMSDTEFTYEAHQIVTERLISLVKESLIDRDKIFLLSFKQAKPDWTIHDFGKFSSIMWKFQNLNSS
jgi:hypothetical protein